VARDPRHALATWDRAAFAVGGRLHAYLEGSSAATLPRDMVQLGAQELIIRTSSVGGWGGLGEEAIDRNIGRSRFADVLLDRRRRPAQPEYALFEVIDWFEDVGDPMRAWQRRLDAVERYAIARMQPGDDLPAVSGCWVVRATQRNRRLVADHRHLFSSRFPGPGHAWLAALGDPARPCRPPQPCYGSLSTARG
jgi:hypothetical protein